MSSARCIVVPVAAAGSGNRRQHRRRLPDLQQVVQLLVFGTRSLMRRTLLESLTHGPLTEPPPEPGEAALAELARAVDRAARTRLGRSLSIRQVDAGSCNGCELEIHALNNA